MRGSSSVHRSKTENFELVDSNFFAHVRYVANAVLFVHFARDPAVFVVSTSNVQLDPVLFGATLYGSSGQFHITKGDPFQAGIARICQHLILATGVLLAPESHVAHALRWDNETLQGVVLVHDARHEIGLAVTIASAHNRIGSGNGTPFLSNPFKWGVVTSF